MSAVLVNAADLRDLHDGWHADVALLDDVDSMSRGDHIIWVGGGPDGGQ